MYIDRKHTIWIREYIDDELTQEEVIDRLENCDEIYADEVEYLYDTVEEMTIGNHYSGHTIELYRESRNEDVLIYKNSL